MEDAVKLMLVLLNSILTAGSVRNMLRIKKRVWTPFLLLSLGFLISECVVYIGDWMNLPASFLLFLAAVYLCGEDSGWKKICIGLLIGSTIFSWNTIVDNFIRAHSSAYLLPRVLFAILFFMGTRRFAPEKDYDLGKRLWKLLLLLTMVPVGSVVSVVLLSETEEQDLRLHFAVLCLSLLSFIGLLWAIRVLEDQKRLEQEAMLLQVNKKYYETMEQQHLEIRRLKHDLANHLRTLLALSPEKRETYIGRLLEDSPLTKSLSYCGDPVINAVLTVKENFFRQRKITLKARLDIPEELPVRKGDLCSIYANALDNAAEACAALPEEEREVVLESRSGKGMLVLKIKNPYKCHTKENTKISIWEPLPKTTKSDEKNHGYGLKSIRESVRKYGGDMEIREEGGMFELFLYIPLLEENKQEEKENGGEEKNI